MKKIKCKVCGTKFPAYKDRLYLAVEHIALLTALSSTSKVFECFDCPVCGCQNTVGVHIPVASSQEDESEDD